MGKKVKIERCTPGQLAKVGVELVSGPVVEEIFYEDHLKYELRCKTCGAEWVDARRKEHGALRPGYWKCPKGCNDRRVLVKKIRERLTSLGYRVDNPDIAIDLLQRLHKKVFITEWDVAGGLDQVPEAELVRVIKEIKKENPKWFERGSLYNKDFVLTMVWHRCADNAYAAQVGG